MIIYASISAMKRLQRSSSHTVQLSARILLPTILTTAISAVPLTSGIASAAPCDGFIPGSSDSLAAIGSSEIFKKLPPSWLQGLPWGLPRLTGHTQAMNFLTGPNSPDMARMNGLNSTDLGIMWDAGDGRVLAAFGDSFSCNGATNGWHSNSLFQTKDMNPANGIYIEGPATGSRSGEFLPPSLKISGVENTIIPTAGIAVHGIQYVDFMSVRSWGAPGYWDTNYAQTARSSDGGKTWTVVQESMRTNSDASHDPRLPRLAPYQPGAEYFQMTAFTRNPADPSYVYVYGTPNGRQGQARLARIPADSFPVWSTAEFWTGSGWSTSMRQAVPVMDGRVSELSVQYNNFLGAWLTIYESDEGMVLRVAPTPQGPWGPKHTLVSRRNAPDIYGGYMYPHQVNNSLYWVSTTWSSYNAILFRTDLQALLG